MNKTKYNDFSQSPEKIPTNILADRLKKLKTEKLIQKKKYQYNPIRYEYTLTEKGRSLEPIMRSILLWGMHNIKDTYPFFDVQKIPDRE